MVGSTQKITCPFCFSTFPFEKAYFRCVSPFCTGRAFDREYATARGYGPTEMGRVLIPPPKREGFAFSPPQDVKCDWCKVRSVTRICPTCHFELPSDITQENQRIIAIIGGRATGKTHYITSLITRLQHEVGRDFGITVSVLGDDTQTRWEQDFYTPLFVRRTVLSPTLPASLDPRVKAPLIFRLIIGSGQNRRVLNLSFFDGAGEDMSSAMSVHNRYISQAHGIIFLLDPLQLPAVRQQSGISKLPTLDPSADPQKLVRSLRELLENTHKLRANQPVKVPIAFTLSKIDVLASMLDPGSALLRSSVQAGMLDLGDLQSVHTEVRSYLSAWISANFCNIIHENFALYHYFGVSSLGHQPDAQNRIAGISPMRVEDPFLWLLYALNILKGRR